MSERIGWMQFETAEELLAFAHDNGARVLEYKGDVNKIFVDFYPYARGNDADVAAVASDYATLFSGLGAPANYVGGGFVNVTMAPEMLPYRDDTRVPRSVQRHPEWCSN